MNRLHYFLAGIMMLLVGQLYAADDVKIQLTNQLSTSTFAIQDSNSTTVATIDARGWILSGNSNQVGKVTVTDGSSNSISITVPGLGSDYTLTLPTNAGTANQFLKTDGSGNLGWSQPPVLYNQSIIAQNSFAADTYLTNSSIAIPSGSLKVGTRYHCIFNVSKTAVSATQPNIYIRFGTAGAIGDVARCTFLFTAQQASIDTGTFEIWATFRVVGGSAVIQGVCQRRHGLSITGLGTLVSETLPVTSGPFDSSVANSYIGVSVFAGATSVWTVQLVQAELTNINY